MSPLKNHCGLSELCNLIKTMFIWLFCSSLEREGHKHLDSYFFTYTNVKVSIKQVIVVCLTDSCSLQSFMVSIWFLLSSYNENMLIWSLKSEPRYKMTYIFISSENRVFISKFSYILIPSFEGKYTQCKPKQIYLRTDRETDWPILGIKMTAAH